VGPVLSAANASPRSGEDQVRVTSLRLLDPRGADWRDASDANPYERSRLRARDPALRVGIEDEVVGSRSRAGVQ
jgi:hypothetical protein